MESAGRGSPGSVPCALVVRVKRFQVREQTRDLNNVLRGFSKLIVSVE
jgi:hypothetical protein